MALNFNKTFTPSPVATKSITPTTTTANVQLNVISGPDSITRSNLRIVNNTGSIVFINFGNDNTVTAAAATSIPVASGSVEVFGCKSDTKYVAAILASGTATGALYFTAGEGI